MAWFGVLSLLLFTLLVDRLLTLLLRRFLLPHVALEIRLLCSLPLLHLIYHGSGAFGRRAVPSASIALLNWRLVIALALRANGGREERVNARKEARLL